MRDYTRSLMAEAHEKGTPVMRTMFYEFPEDAACWDISDAYMFGSDILVAPIVRPKATSRTVYLPAGASWTLANTGDVYEGGKPMKLRRRSKHCRSSCARKTGISGGRDLI